MWGGGEYGRARERRGALRPPLPTLLCALGSTVRPVGAHRKMFYNRKALSKGVRPGSTTVSDSPQRRRLVVRETAGAARLGHSRPCERRDAGPPRWRSPRSTCISMVRRLHVASLHAYKQACRQGSAQSLLYTSECSTRGWIPD